MKRIAASIVTVLLLAAPASAEKAVQREMNNDVVLRALVDELERGNTGLKLQDLERPYFIEYALADTGSARVTAELGAVTSSNTSRSRRLRADVRVGSYELDNTNFGGGYGGFDFGGAFGGMFWWSAIPIEDDYNAIRQAIWWDTDRQYKSVLESLAQKKAFMETKVIEDKPEDFSRELPTVYFEDRIDPSLGTDRLERLAVALSKVFRDHPQVKQSSATLRATQGNNYLVNTEGSRLRTAETIYSLTVSATVQADDGMELSDTLSVYTRRLEELPSLDELAGRCRDMAEQLVAVKNAPLLDNYIGPVLFDAEAAASVFSQQMLRRFAGGQRPVGSRRSPDDFANMLNRRILPRFMNVVDDPTQEAIAGTPVTGHYNYDDQGVPARRVSLIEGGRLKALLMSRNPSKEFKKSTGHGRGSRQPRATAGCLIVTADPPADAATLRQELIEACQDEGLEYGIRIASLGGTGAGAGVPAYLRRYEALFGFSDMGSQRGTTPLVMYKVYPDGREELVRGAEIARFDLKAFKRMLAAGDTPYVLNSGGAATHTVVAPAMLFEELDLAKMDRDFDKPPILPTPLARAPVEEK